ncbi:MAG: citrate transporter [Oscillospiraceae bacterium]|nr:citrate transporter [Oscillospiraceae bacterium]
MGFGGAGGKYTPAFYIHSAIGIFFMFFFRFLPIEIYPITPVGMQVVGVFLGLVWLWCFVGFLWPSLLGFVAYGLTDLVTFAQVGTASFGGGVPILLLFSMILFGSPQHVGATRYITRFFLTRKVLNGRPIVFAFIYFFATYALSVAVNVTPALVLMWAVLYGVLKELGYSKGEKFTALMIVGTFLGAISGQASLPFTGSTLAILNSLNVASENILGFVIAVPAPHYMLTGFINTVIVMAIYCGFMKLTLKKDELTKVAHVSTEMFDREPLPPMSKLQKANFGSMLLFVVLMLIPAVLRIFESLNSDSWAAIAVLNTLGPAGIAIGLCGAMVLIKVEGEPVLDFRAVAAKSINWDVYIMVAIAMAISGGLTNAATGVLDWMIMTFEPIMGGHTATMTFVMTLLVGAVITNFASSMVIGIAFMPVLVFFGAEAGVNLPALATVTILLLHYSILLPSASVFAAMLWSNEEWISAKDVFKYGAVVAIVALVIALAIMMPVANFIMPPGI